MKRVYNTGKVKIGLAYEPPIHREMTLDEERLQLALLAKGKPSNAGLLSYASIVAVAIAAAIAIIH